MSIKMPVPDAGVLSRRDEIVAALRRIVPGEEVTIDYQMKLWFDPG